MRDIFSRQAAARDGEACQRCEAALADLADGTLSAEQEAGLRAHAAGCENCAALLQGAEDGKAWLRFLHDAPPLVPDGLTERILARTSAHPLYVVEQPHGVQAVPAAIGTALAPVWANSRQHRWLMTAAMAFFSIAVTLSVAGVRAADLNPQNVQAAASRQFFDVKKQVVSFYDNLALVRELQATIDGLHQSHGSGSGDSSLQPQQGYTLYSTPELSMLALNVTAGERTLP